MPATQPQPTTMEDKDVEEGPTASVPTSDPVTAVPSSTPPSPTSGISMASNGDGVTALHSPAEASPAKPAVTLPTISGTSPAGSHIVSASDSPAYAASIMKSAVVDFGNPNAGNEYPNTLTCKGVTVTLENGRVWKQFHNCGTEMILTKPGRRMFPYCRYRLTGLDPERHYSLMLSIVPSDKYKYRWNSPKWEVVGPAEYQTQVPVRGFSHHYSPCRGSDLMGCMLSFYKLKVTNNPKDLEGHIVLTSMHRYIPQLHVIPLLNGDITPPLVMGPESLTFTFPQTEFMAVTTYQNFLVTQLKITHNPFAKGFREDRDEPCLRSISMEMLRGNIGPHEEQPGSKPLDESPNSIYDHTEQNGDIDNDELPSKRPLIKTPKVFVASVPRTFGRCHSKRNGRWSRLKERLNLAASLSAAASVSAESELDEVEGLTFVSFATREALESHIRAEPSYKSTPVSPDSCLMTPAQPMETEAIAEMTEEKIVRLEAILLEDLKVAKYRQVIHPVLQEVGLKLSSLDPSMPIDLLYLGVRLPLPPLKLPAQNHDSEGLAFISRTGKTSDMTKIKGWKNKFVHSKQPCDGSQKNMSAFCSNMLDAYLEREAQQISERATAFSAGPEAPVAYRLPSKSASYVKTLDSALKHRKTTIADINNRPCPLSFKPLLYAALTSPPPHLATTAPSSSASRPHRPTQTSQLISSVAQQKLLEMEDDIVSQGCSRTQLTSERVSTSLAVMLTKEKLQQQTEKSPPHSARKAARTKCGQEFCRLGCVCFSLLYPVVGPLHCSQPACMFGCTCSKQTTQDGLLQDEATAAGTALVYKQCSTAKTKKLWNRNCLDTDQDPLFQPKSQCVPPAKPLESYKAPLEPYKAPPSQQIQEEEKDPVYKYLESFLTCARVRAFNSKPPSQNKLDYIPSLATNSIKRSRPTSEPKEQENLVSKERMAKKQIEIQSVCNWEEDREMILESLCRRLHQDKLSEPFSIGPYLIHPVTKIFIQKPSGSHLTYRVRVSRSSKVRDGIEEHSYNKTGEDPEQSVQHSEVKPFLAGVLPAGLMVARTKPVGQQASELIQVNGKSYNYVNLLLGSMGALHPANRLAAYATGRLQLRADLTRRVDQTATATSVHKVNEKPANQNLETAKPACQNSMATGRLLPLVMSAKSINDVQTHPRLFQLLKQPCVKKEPESPPSRQLAPLAAINPFQRTPRSPVSLTVSPSLKTPSFLSQSGTYTFRICPPSYSGEKDKNLSSVNLPGGFSLIRLPKPAGPNEPKSQAAQEGTSNGSVMAAAINETQAIKEEEHLSSSSDCESSMTDSSDVDSIIDIESIEDSKQLMAQYNPPVLCTDNPNEPRTKKRRNHSVIEKQRRIEHRALFDELQKVLGQDGGSRLHLLSLALREIQMLKLFSDGLLERKKKLAQIQALHVKKLSSLSGKPEDLIKRNLSMVFSSLKDKGSSKTKPFFMRLYQSKEEPAKDAATTSPPSPVLAPPPTPEPQLLPPTPPPVDPTHQLEAPSLPSPAPQKPVQHNKTPPAQPNKCNQTPPPAQQFAIPLIRSKTGRLILPSSMKPAAQGIYTLMLMNPKQDADVTSTNSSNTDLTDSLDRASPTDADQDSPVQKLTVYSREQMTPLSNSSPLPTRRPRGRPRKTQRILKSKAKPEKDIMFIPSSRKKQPARRRRGRPRKSEPVATLGDVVGHRAATSEYAVGCGASRPRTRGSLGKDFPSAKRQSWIDIAMELDPDSDSD
ncbi:MAX gene-associated protein isoform 4-T6 [Syngnathus typhle]